MASKSKPFKKPDPIRRLVRQFTESVDMSWEEHLALYAELDSLILEECRWIADNFHDDAWMTTRLVDLCQRLKPLAQQMIWLRLLNEVWGRRNFTKTANRKQLK